LLIRKASTLNADRSRAMLRRADAMKSTPGRSSRSRPGEVRGGLRRGATTATTIDRAESRPLEDIPR
jgi:hypothetical protein